MLFLPRRGRRAPVPALLVAAQRRRGLRRLQGRPRAPAAAPRGRRRRARALRVRGAGRRRRGRRAPRRLRRLRARRGEVRPPAAGSARAGGGGGAPGTARVVRVLASYEAREHGCVAVEARPANMGCAAVEARLAILGAERQTTPSTERSAEPFSAVRRTRTRAAPATAEAPRRAPVAARRASISRTVASAHRVAADCGSPDWQLEFRHCTPSS